MGAASTTDSTGPPDDDGRYSGTHLPAACREGPRRGDRPVPATPHFFVRPLIVTAEIAVADVGAHFLRRHQSHPFQIDHRLLLSGLREAGDACPREILHPGRMGGDRIDRFHHGPGLWRIPPVVELDA